MAYAKVEYITAGHDANTLPITESERVYQLRQLRPGWFRRKS